MLLEQFKTLVKGSADLSLWSGLDKKEQVARTADLIWSYLSPSYGKMSDEKGDSVSGDSAHVQFLTSFLLERRLDSFGLTFATLAAFQILFPKSSADLFLTLSEDHSWISIRQGNTLTRVEVTWHGKIDKRGPVSQSVSDNWLYLKGHAVVCDTAELTLAALISSMNPALSATVDSLPLAKVQRMLLSKLHDRGTLNRYPMALGNLADLVELSASATRVESVIKLYYEAITSAITHYENHHIYPYLYLAGFWFRSRVYSHALFCWRNAANVVSRYNYNPKEDEEAYKEFQEIASDLIPYALNQLASGDPGLGPQHYRDLIEFYDGLCAWEESSRWPVLHIGWSKSFVSCLNKFPHTVRGQVTIKVSEAPADATEEDTQKESFQESECKKLSRSKEEIMKLVENCSKDATFLLSPTDVEEDSADRSVSPDSVDVTALTPVGPTEIKVSSQKMTSVKDLLTKSDGKLNSSAIQLQITAQSSLSTTSKGCTRVASPQQMNGKRLRCK